ncbi:MAG: lysophospholipid acyltransferase family protein [Chitinophagaceae bacterium]|nr:lysophospholipid acyltransferase family protein [Chitinophagaceae bacterium]
MYYLTYGIFYLLSLLPFRVIYLLSDFAYVLVYYVFGYRKKLVLGYLKDTFPEKTEQERIVIAKKVFQNFCDVWVEMIKILSMTEKKANRLIKSDLDCIKKYYKEGKSVQIVGGHFMNWEYLPVGLPISLLPFKVLAIYMPLSNKVMERLVLKIRSRFGLVLLKAGNMGKEMKEWAQKQYVMVVGADQSPSNPGNAYWLQFCNKPTGFIDGPWKRAVKQNQPYIYLKIRKIKRGHYQYMAVPFEEDPSSSTPQALALKFAHMLEQEIREIPELYLWTHKRWKRPWKPEYAGQWIDSLPMPKS